MRTRVNLFAAVVLFGLTGLMLVVASAEAALTWGPLVYGTQDVPEDGREINYAVHGQGINVDKYTHSFNILLQAPTTPGLYGTNFAQQYRIFIDLTPDGDRSTYDYALGFNVHTTYVYPGPGWTTIWLGTLENNNSAYPNLAPENFNSYPSNGYLGTSWSITLAYRDQIGTGNFEWWAETRGSGATPVTYDYTNMQIVTPIPAAIWLFGSGLLGLVGLARNRSKK